MNIIVSSLNSTDVRLTNYDSNMVYDINTVKIFIAKNLGATPLSLNLFRQKDEDAALIVNPLYSLSIIQNTTFDKNNYYGYVLTTDTSIPSASYQVTLIFDEAEVVLESPINFANDLEDEHDPFVINERTITVGKKTVIIAEDCLSQQIEFLIKEKYDGVSFLDDSKQIYIDYIPVDFKPFIDDQGNEINFLSSEIKEKEPIIRNGENWLNLKWNVPYDFSKTAGVVKFALTVLGVDGMSYVWQTSPAQIKIQPNLGRRPVIPVSSVQESTLLAETLERVNNLEEFATNVDNVSSINTDQGTITYTTRDEKGISEQTISILDLAIEGTDEEEIVVGGGGAPVEEG